jgi:hypothetical protein
MNEQALRFRNVAAATLLIGGVLIVALPRYAATVVQLVIATVGISGGVYALAAHVPPTGWLSPFRWLSPFGGSGRLGRRRRQRTAIEHIRSRFAGRRQRLVRGPPLPPAVLRQMQPVIAAALNLDPRDPTQLAAARGRVSPLTFAVLTCVPMERPSWLRTVRPDPPRVAEAVHRILDDLGLPATGDLDAHPSVDPIAARGT